MRKCVLYHVRPTKAQISAFVVRCLDSIISRFYSRNFKTLTAQAGLCLARSKTPEDTFCHDEAQV